jgi:hypothetical protein
MSFLFFILFLIIFIGIAILLSILGVVRNILGFGRKRNPFPGDNNPNDNRSDFDSRKTQQKVFGENEGEYVDYEEIKDK